MRTLTLSLTLWCLILSGVARAWTDDKDFTWPSLKGMQGLALLVELDDKSEQNLISNDSVMATFVQLLHEAGVKAHPYTALGKQPLLDTNMSGMLIMNVDIAGDDQMGIWLWTIELQLVQFVILKRQAYWATAPIHPASTWEYWERDAASPPEFERRFWQTVEKVVDRFLIAYLSQNPLLDP